MVAHCNSADERSFLEGAVTLKSHISHAQWNCSCAVEKSVVLLHRDFWFEKSTLRNICSITVS